MIIKIKSGESYTFDVPPKLKSLLINNFSPENSRIEINCVAGFGAQDGGGGEEGYQLKYNLNTTKEINLHYFYKNRNYVVTVIRFLSIRNIGEGNIMLESELIT